MDAAHRNLEIGLNLVVGSSAVLRRELDRQRSAAWKKRAGFCMPLAFLAARAAEVEGMHSRPLEME